MARSKQEQYSTIEDLCVHAQARRQMYEEYPEYEQLRQMRLVDVLE